jgi:hypothetical protein
MADANKIKDGDIMAVMHYIKVKGSNPISHEFWGDDVDQPGKGMKVTGKELVERAFSADQYDKEEKVSKTKAAEILVTSHNRPFTVSFEKSDKSQRTLRGRLIKAEPLLGRSMVEELDIVPETGDLRGRVRQVDHRTISWLIVEGTKYIVK